MTLTQDLLHELFDYRDGELYWTCDRGPRIRAGDKAGSFSSDVPYMRITINKKIFLLHRLIYLYHTGESPKVVDHTNLNKLDNRIENLRAASTAENMRNRKLSKANTSGFKGVSWCKQKKLWTAQIVYNNQNRFLGRFSDKISAAKAYNDAAISLFGEFAILNIF